MKSEADTLTSAFLWLTTDWEKPTPSSTGENDWIYLCRLGGGGVVACEIVGVDGMGSLVIREICFLLI